MACPRCRHENRSGARFCEECAAPLARACSACATTISPTAKFCPECAHPVDAPAPSRPAAAGATSAYTPRHLAERILSSRSAIEGERKQVTVLFVDVVESTRLAGRLDPEAMHEVMDRVLRLMAEAVHRYDGTVNQFLGDGLMALFGAPLALEDHAQRAVEAAFAIQETIGGLSAELLRERGAQIQLRIGLNTGPVVVGKIGDDLRMDYTAVGDSTNLAARMQGLAGAGEILVTEATHRLVEGVVRSESLGPLPVKGLSHPVPAYRLLARHRRTRLAIGVERGLTTLVERRSELEVLRERLEHARAGHGQVVGIVGEPGVGKSRLLWELRSGLAGEETAVSEAHCPALSHPPPYAPIADLLRSVFQIEDGDNPLQVEEKMRRMGMALGPALAGSLALLRELVGLSPDEATTRLDPKTRRLRTFEAIRAALAAAGRGRPQVILVEDLHWIDPTSEDCLAFLIDSIGALPILLLTTYRPGYAVRWADRAYFSQIALDPLAEAGTAAILSARLGAHELPEGLAPLVHAKAEGNPLFVEEIALALLERGVVTQTSEGLGWAREQAVDVPATGQDIIRARIDGLPEPVKRTLQTAAVIGREFSARLLEHVVEQPAELDEQLARLRRVELVHATRFVPEPAYAFKHALIRDVAYDMLLARRQREVHTAIGRALEELYQDRMTDQYEVLAHHFGAGGERGKAVEYLIKAGEKAAAAYANTEAVVRFEQALGLVDPGESATRARLYRGIAEAGLYHLPPEKVIGYAQSALDLHLQLGDRRGAMSMHHVIAGTYMSSNWDGAREDAALEHLEEAARLGADEPDSVTKGLVLQRTAHLYLHRGMPGTALGWAQRARDLFERIGAGLGTSLGTAMTYAGSVDEGVAHNEGNWPGVVRLGNPLIVSVLGHELTLTLALARDARRARAWGERALDEILRLPPASVSSYIEGTVRRPKFLAAVLAGAVGDAGRECELVEEISAKTLAGCAFEDAACVGFHHYRQGRWAEARGVTDRMLASMEARNQGAAVSACAYVLGCIDLAEGRHAAAEAQLSRSLSHCREGGNVLFELWVLPALGEVYLAQGRRDRAVECLERGQFLLAPGRGWYGLPAGLELVRGMLAREQGSLDEAVAAFSRAAAINQEHGLPWDEARALLEWGRLLRERGREDQQAEASDRLLMAQGIFRELGADHLAAEAGRSRS